jgi:hypothetical protein
MIEGSKNPYQILKITRIFGVCLLIGVIVYFLTKDVEGISIDVKDDMLSLSYSSGDSFEFRYADILSVTETQHLDLGKYISGTDTKRYQFGVWENEEFGKYNLCIYANVARYIVVETSSGIFVFNTDSEDATESFYKAFLELLQTNQAEAALWNLHFLTHTGWRNRNSNYPPRTAKCSYIAI